MAKRHWVGKSTIKKRQILQQIGTTGLKQYGGYISAEPEPRLRGASGAAIFDLMSRSDPVIAGGLYIIKSMVNQVPWFIRPGGTRKADVLGADFLQSCIYDMSVSWNQTVTDIMTMVIFGWSYLEIVHKIRRGRHWEDGRFRSQYNDGAVGWRRWAPRSQLSLDHWAINEVDGSVEGMFQRDPSTGAEYYIPLKKALLFRFGGANDNPEGESPIRPCWDAWVNKSTIEEIMRVGLERDLAGYPILRAPKDVMERKTEKAADAYADALDLVTNIRNDEAAGTVLSSECDSKGNKMWDLELLASGGQKQFNLVQIIAMYDQRIAAAFLVDILLLGSGRQGSYALAETKDRLLSSSISAILDSVCEVVNQHAVARLAELNPDIFEHLEKLPELAHGKVEIPNLTQLSESLAKLGYKPMWSDPDALIETYIRELADLPVTKAATTGGEAVDVGSLEKAFRHVRFLKELREGKGRAFAWHEQRA